ncbi:MAG: SPOR domain-containing protein [Flavobacteriales bacterium]
MTLERDIHELLYDHDCVIVPGFGGFLTHYRPARLDEQRRTVHPPSKDLSFNRQLTRHDGLLADHFGRREGVDFNAAKNAIEAQTAEWTETLVRQGRVELPRIGTFFHDAELNLQFEPDRRVNFLKDAYGLRPVAAHPVIRQVVAVEPPRKVVPLLPPAITVPRSTNGMLAAAAMAAVLFTAATWWAISSTGNKNALWSSFDFLPGASQAEYVLPEPPEPGPAAPLAEDPWVAPNSEEGVHLYPVAGDRAPVVAVDLNAQKAKVAAPESTAVASSGVRAKYHVVGGCFLEKENADRFIAELQAKGFAASLIDKKGGLYRVAIGSYPLRTTALEALDAVRREEAPDAWMLVK